MASIIKAKADYYYTVINNQILRDPNISMGAKGLFCYLQSLPEDWIIKVDELQNHFNNGRDSVRAKFNELQENGYIQRKEQTNNGQFGKVEYVVYPVLPLTGKPCTENPTLLIKHKQKNIITPEATGAKSKQNFGNEYKKFVDYLNKHLKKKYRGDAKSRRQFSARVMEGYNAQDFALALKNAMEDDHHKENEYKWLTPEFMTRVDKLEKFINSNPSGGPEGYNKYLQ